MENSKKTKQNIVLYIIFGVLFVSLLVFLLWKCKYGYGNYDECFYLSIPYRLYQGDSLITQEWHLTQLASFLVYPLISIYMLIFKSTVGIVLNFRYIYTIIQSICALVIFLRLKKYNFIGATISSLVFLAFAPFGIMALSYNTLGIMSLTLSGVLLCTSENKPVPIILSGFLFAAAVLCSPYSASIFVFYVIAVFINTLASKKKGYKKDSVFTTSTLVKIIFGIAIMFVVFSIFVLSRASISGIIKCLPNILNDSEHVARSALSLFNTYTYWMFEFTPETKYFYMGLLFILCISLLDPKRSKHQLIYIPIATILVILIMATTSFEKGILNMIMYPMMFLAIIIWVLNHENRLFSNILYTMIIPGFIFSVCAHISSNNYYLAVSQASTVATVGSVFIVAVKVQDILKNEKTNFIKIACCFLLCSVLLLQLGGEIVLRYKAVFWDSQIEMLDTKLSEEIEDGVVTTQYNLGIYNSLEEQAKYINSKFPKGSKLLSLTRNCGIYLLCSDLENASYSAWVPTDLNTNNISASSIDKLYTYYQINPDKMPDCILMDDSSKEFVGSISAMGNYRVTHEFSNGTLLLSK